MSDITSEVPQNDQWQPSSFATGFWQGWRCVERLLLVVLAAAAVLAVAGTWCLYRAQQSTGFVSSALRVLRFLALGFAACAPVVVGVWAAVCFWRWLLAPSAGARRPAADAYGRFVAALAAVCVAAIVPLLCMAGILFGGPFSSPSALDRLGELLAFCGSGWESPLPGLPSLAGPVWMVALLALPLSGAWWAASRVAMTREARRPLLPVAGRWIAVTSSSGAVVLVISLLIAVLARQSGVPEWLPSAAVLAEATLMAAASVLLVRAAGRCASSVEPASRNASSTA